MKKIFLSLFILLQINVNAQDIFLRNFVNEVAREVIPDDLLYYNLVDSSFNMKLDKYTFNDDEKEFLKLYPDFPLELTQRVFDSTIINWRKTELKDARYYSYKNLPRHLSSSFRVSKNANLNLTQKQIDSLNKTIASSELYVKFKPNWNDERRKKEAEKAWERNDKFISKENRIYYQFSTPQFSTDKAYAIISIKKGSSGSTLIFKRTEVGWKKIYEFNRWVA